MYWIKLFKDIRLWRKFAKITKNNREKLEEHGLRVDNLGRMYTVINLPEDVIKGNEYMHEAWVFKNLEPYNKAISDLGLSGYAYPEVSKIKEPGTAAYLVVLYPETATISIKRFLLNILLWGGGFIIVRAFLRIANDYIDFAGIWETITNYLF